MVDAVFHLLYAVAYNASFAVVGDECRERLVEQSVCCFGADQADGQTYFCDTTLAVMGESSAATGGVIGESLRADLGEKRGRAGVAYEVISCGHAICVTYVVAKDNEQIKNNTNQKEFFFHCFKLNCLLCMPNCQVV